MQGHCDAALCARMNETYIISCSKDSDVKVWDRHEHTLMETLVGHVGPVNAVEFNTTYVVSASADHTIIVWDYRNFKKLRRIVAHKKAIVCLQLVDKLAVTGCMDYSVRIHNVETGEHQRTFHGYHTKLVRSVYIHRNLLLSGSYDMTLGIWDVYTEELVGRIVGLTEKVICARMDRTRLVVATNSGSVHIFDFAANIGIHTDALVGGRLGTKPALIQWDRPHGIDGGRPIGNTMDSMDGASPQKPQPQCFMAQTRRRRGHPVTRGLADQSTVT